MRCIFRLAAVAVIVLSAAVSRAEDPTTQRTDPRLANVPGPFHAFNVTGTYKGRYHSQVAEYGLEPMMMIFTRKVDFSEPLKDLIKQIDAAMEKNPAARLHAFVVVQSDDLPEVVGADDATDDKRIELAQTLEDEARGLGLVEPEEADKGPAPADPAAQIKKRSHVVIVLAGKSDLEKYREPYKLDEAGFAFFLFQRGKVTAAHVVKNDDVLTPADVKTILALDVAPFGPQATALLVTRDADLSDPMKDLLKQIDNATDKNPSSRLHPILAYLSDDPKRNETAAHLEEQAKALGLQHVEVIAAGPSDLLKYNVGDAGFGFFLSQHGAVLAERVLKKDESMSAGVTAEVVKTLAEKVGADQK